MADEVQELLVSIRSEGTDEVTEDLRNQREQFEESADTIADETATLAAFSRKWKGAGLLFAGSFAVITGAIVSKLPVLKEVATGFDILLTSLALKIDQDIRPAVGGLTDEFIDLAEEINEAESAAEGVGILLGGVAESIGRQLDDFDPELTAEVTADFIVEVGAVTVDRSGLRDMVVRAIEDPVPLLIEVFKLLQIPTAFVWNLGISLGERLADAIIQEVDAAFEDARERLNRLKNDSSFIFDFIEQPGRGPRFESGGGRYQASSLQSATTPAQRRAHEIMGTIDTQVNLDSRQIAAGTKSFTARGALARGRGARLG